jgi:hypothetical protein
MRATSLIVILGLTLGACAGSQHDSETLQESILSYNDGVRWERFETAATSLPPKQRSGFVDEMDQRAKDLKISQFDVVRVDKTGAKVAKVHVKLGWYMETEGTLKETHAMQTWERHGKAWWLVEQSRLRGDEMPGLMDRPEGAFDDPKPDPK